METAEESQKSGETKPGVIKVYFLQDGFTALGEVWYRGQDTEVVVGSEDYEKTKNSQGDSWLDLISNPAAQKKKYGKVMFSENIDDLNI
jgi:hypothetical protein